MTEVLKAPEKCMNHDDMECSDPTTTIEDSPSASKKLKQARLPFKPIGPKTQLTLTPHGLPKKRKLSDQESPSAKAAKVASKHQSDRGRLEAAEKSTAPIEHENEVSSSSEAENIPIGGSQKRKGFENNILERFVRKSSQEEISSTNEVVDLTEGNESNSNAPEVMSTVKNAEPKKQAKEEENVIILDDSNTNEIIEKINESDNSRSKDLKASDAECISKVPKVSSNDTDKVESGNFEESKENTIQENVKVGKNTKNDNSEDVKKVPSEQSTPKEEDNDMAVDKQSTEKSEALNSSCKTDIALEVSIDGDKLKDKSLDSSLSSSKSVSDESSSSEDDSDEANDSMADVSLSSPGNNSSVNTSTCKTPKAKGANLSGITKTPGGSSVQTSTPKSAKGKPQSLKMSEIKSAERKKEREALRQRAREQKEQQQRERKQKKEQEKLEAKRRRDEEKAEKEKKKLEEKEKKERERLEKKEQLEKEKMEKQQQKEEEKKKKQELIDAKLEEKKKKEEERKKKEEEKKMKEEEKLKEEEEKNKKKMKAKESFSSFFIKKAQQQAAKPKEASCIFMPFEVKKDMFLAPPCRRQLGDDDKTVVDENLTKQECTSLYLADLKKPSYQKGQSARTLPRVKDVEPAPEVENEGEMECDGEVECEGEVECLETTESAEKKKILERHHCKLLQFHTNYRPPYYGTWRKKSDVIKPTKPFSQDTELLDYEVDSDDEWEEEEPGESVSSSEDEGEEKEEDAEEEEEEDGWMVPHGYLSEDEGCDQDEEITPELMKARQMAKQEAWEAEQKRQKAPVKAIVIGCHWDGEEVAERLAAKLAKFRAVCLSAVPIDTRKKMAEAGGKEGEKNGAGKGNRKPVPEEAMPDLIRLLHRNVIGIKKVIKEFRLYWKKKTSNTLGEGDADNMEVDEGAAEKDLSTLDQSVTEEKSSKDGETEAASPGGDDDKAQECADGCGMSKRQLEIKIGAIAVREKRPEFKRVCWYVHDKILKQYGMEDLPLVNAWQYVSKGLIRVKNEEACGRKTPNSLSESFTDSVQVIMKDEEEEAKVEKPKDQPSIMQFAKKMAPSELPKPKIRRIELKPANLPTQTNGAKQVSPVADLDTSANEEVLGPYKVLPKDQRSIMDFAKKPASSPKAAKKPSKITPKKTAISPLVKKPVKKEVIKGEINEGKKETSLPVPVTDKAVTSAKTSEAPDEAMEVDDCIVLD